MSFVSDGSLYAIIVLNRDVSRTDDVEKSSRVAFYTLDVIFRKSHKYLYLFLTDLPL